MAREFDVAASSMQELGLDQAKDKVIFERARLAGAAILTKDADFVDLVRQRGPPPCILWLAVGNTSTVRVQDALTESWPRIERSLVKGEALIELRTKGPRGR